MLARDALPLARKACGLVSRRVMRWCCPAFSVVQRSSPRAFEHVRQRFARSSGVLHAAHGFDHPFHGTTTCERGLRNNWYCSRGATAGLPPRAPEPVHNRAPCQLPGPRGRVAWAHPGKREVAKRQAVVLGVLRHMSAAPIRFSPKVWCNAQETCIEFGYIECAIRAHPQYQQKTGRK